MKVASKQPGAPARDARAVALPLFVDDAGLAHAVQNAPSPEKAWEALGLPGERAGVDPDVLDRLLGAARALCATSDAIGKGLSHFGRLAAGEEAPASWVDRMVELHVAELEGFWGLDDLAYRGLEVGGWTVTTPETLLLDPAARVAQRARWQAAHLRPRAPALWFDRLERAVGQQPDAAAAKAAGRELVSTAARRRFDAWSTTRTEATT